MKIASPAEQKVLLPVPMGSIKALSGVPLHFFSERSSAAGDDEDRFALPAIVCCRNLCES